MAGLAGVVVNVSQQMLTDTIASINQGYPGCTFSLGDLSLASIVVAKDLNGNAVNTLDAVAFGLGQNNIPK